ncbi:hypothetical protein SAICODRAFT_21594 [Saitoella complicata NRRL Y-17804]|uniref:uncharacterized protein n=1 Tax=Saitoella complicata (strain BCRC 22490 / CBS 7301 / JCM 7358 / NBRC 10748 / NRRL Y-17804) TaxID=698492 RepID=UPI0008675008|nr:uncharacterized protein SAICODRAFT_21594 [Saitoella complicata NRRL Y-17804]ODQ50347.1 hypothetical protein SAICODRAFT_21594 [Saitoella complicata NRRL Y-17804]
MSPSTPYAESSTAFPIFALAWSSNTTLLLAGGGGASRSGVANRLDIRELKPLTKEGEGKGAEGEVRLESVGEYVLSREEDAPMCLDVNDEGVIATGINAKNGPNEHLRLFKLKANTIEEDGRKQLFKAPENGDGDDYQRVAVYNASGSLLASASTDGSLAVVNIPDRSVAWTSGEPGQEIYDAAFSWPEANEKESHTAAAELFAYVTPSTLYLHNAPDGKLIRTISPSSSSKPAQFRCVRFLPRRRLLSGGKVAMTGAVMVAALNSKPSGSAWIVRYTPGGAGVERTQKLRSSVTCMDVASTGTIAVACANLSIHVLSPTLVPLRRVQQAHSFPATCLRWRPEGGLVASGSVDARVRVWEVEGGRSSAMTVLVAVLVLVVLVLVVVVVGMWWFLVKTEPVAPAAASRSLLLALAATSAGVVIAYVLLASKKSTDVKGRVKA